MHTILGININDFFKLHMFIANNYYQDNIGQNYTFDNLADFLKNTADIDPVQTKGSTLMYLAKHCSPRFDPKLDYSSLDKQLEEYPAFQVLNKSQFINEAFKSHEKIETRPASKSTPEEIKVNEELYNEEGLNFEDYLATVIAPPKLDKTRFIGLAALHYTLFLNDVNNYKQLRNTTKSNSEFKEKLLGKGKKGNGPLKKLTHLITNGYGLVNSDSNHALLQLLKTLEREAENRSVFNPAFNKHMNNPRKRFPLRMLSMMHLEHGDQNLDAIKLTVYHLTRALSEKEATNTYEARNNELRQQINTLMDLLNQHRDNVLSSDVYLTEPQRDCEPS